MSILKAERIYRDELQTVIVFYSADVYRERSDTMLGLYARYFPVAIVVSSQSGAHAVDMNAEPVEVDGLLDDAGVPSVFLEHDPQINSPL